MPNSANMDMDASYPDTPPSFSQQDSMANSKAILESPDPLSLLSAFSCLSVPKTLPPISEIREIHIYDFDNTLFSTPLPNVAMWSPKWTGALGDPNIFLSGGWWHDPGLLASVGFGVEIEEQRAWEGWWNENVVELVRISCEQDDILTVLLTGRSKDRFSDLLNKILTSKGLEFDLLCLKPNISPFGTPYNSTETFKHDVLKVLLDYYKNTTEVRVYEDRKRHIEGFTRFLKAYNENIGERTPLKFNVIMVQEISSSLDPVTEAAQIQRMVNDHNRQLAALEKSGQELPKGLYGKAISRPWKLDKQVIMTFFAISPSDSSKLTALLPKEIEGLNILANRIFITIGQLWPDNLARMGGLGKTVKFQVKSIGFLEGETLPDGKRTPTRIWAVRVAPMDETQFIWVSPGAFKGNARKSGIPNVILAIRSDTNLGDVKRIKNWTDVSQSEALVFDGVLREAMRLGLEEILPPSEQPDAESGAKRKHHPSSSTDLDSQRKNLDQQQQKPPLQQVAYRQTNNRSTSSRFPQRGFGNPRGGFGGRGRGRGEGRGGFRTESAMGRGSSNRGRGGSFRYHDLDALPPF